MKRILDEQVAEKKQRQMEEKCRKEEYEAKLEEEINQFNNNTKNSETVDNNIIKNTTKNSVDQIKKDSFREEDIEHNTKTNVLIDNEKTEQECPIKEESIHDTSLEKIKSQIQVAHS